MQLTGGGLKYSEVNTELFQRIWEYYREARRKREQLLKEPEIVREILRAGAAKARSKALPTLELVCERVGLAD